MFINICMLYNIHDDSKATCDALSACIVPWSLCHNDGVPMGENFVPSPIEYWLCLCSDNIGHRNMSD